MEVFGLFKNGDGLEHPTQNQLVMGRVVLSSYILLYDDPFFRCGICTLNTFSRVWRTRGPFMLSGEKYM